MLVVLEARGAARAAGSALCGDCPGQAAAEAGPARTPSCPCPRFAAVDRPADLPRIGAELGWPLMLKARRDGYDGHGNALVADRSQADQRVPRLGWPERAALRRGRWSRSSASWRCSSCAARTAGWCLSDRSRRARTRRCTSAAWFSRPPTCPRLSLTAAARIARGAVEAVDGVGAFGVELFLLPDGQVLINELAPRPHNSAHYSIEACSTSQFSNHVRAVLGLPLGDADAAHTRGGDGQSPRHRRAARRPISEPLSRDPATFVHLYGKTENRPGRKLGHVTALGDIAGRSACARATAPRSLARYDRAAGGHRHGQLVRPAHVSPRRRDVERFGVPHELRVLSAHRTPDAMAELRAARPRRAGCRSLIAGAGGAAHLPGMLAAHTPLPVIGVPVPTTPERPRFVALDRADARGVPVATVAIGAGDSMRAY